MKKRTSLNQTGKASLNRYMLMLLGFFGLVILLQSISVLRQHSLSLQNTQPVILSDLPYYENLGKIQYQVDQSLLILHAHLLLHGAEYQDKLQKIWQNKIWPVVDSLAKLDNSQAEELAKVEKLLFRLESAQNAFFIVSPTKPATQQQTVIAEDSLDIILRQFEAYKARTEEQALMVEKWNDEILILQQELHAQLQRMQTDRSGIISDRMTGIAQAVKKNNFWMIFISVTGLLIVVLLAFKFLKKMRNSIGIAASLLENLSMGKLQEGVQNSDDEIDAVISSGSKLNANLKAASQFAQSIGEGNFSTSYQPASQHDTLGNALVQMRDRLLKVAEEDKRRNWSTSGLAQIGEILRKDYHTSEQLYLNIIRFIVKYLDANQAGLFLINRENEENCLELVACYAYERQKFLEKRIEPGEGLIGQCYLEGEPIFLTEVPESYLSITSGLGKATPKSILICPLKVNEEVIGVIELASFHMLDDYQLEFIRKMSESIASTISSVKVAHRTTQLLEETRQQAEEMRAQEEEMRQNNEELQATQEEMQRKGLEAEEQNSKLQAVLDATVDAIITIDERGRIESINRAGLKLFGYEKEELIGENVKILTPNAHRDQHDQYLKNYRESGIKKVIGIPREEKGRKKDGTLFDLSLAVNEAFAGERRIFTGILRDISQQKALENELRQQVEDTRSKEEELLQNLEEMSAIQEELENKSQESATQHAKMKAILDSTVDAIITIDEKGLISTANPASEKLFGYSQEEMIGQNVNMLMPVQHSKQHDQYLKNYQETGARKIIGMPREEKGRRKDGSEFYLAIAVNEAKVGNNRIFTGILRDISQQKEMEAKLQQQLEEAIASEEELRQAMEELTTIQEDLENKNRELAALHKQKPTKTKGES